MGLVIIIALGVLVGLWLFRGTRSGSSDGLSWLERREGKGRRCPFCVEVIQPKATVCKHCGRDLAAPVLPGMDE